MKLNEEKLDNYLRALTHRVVYGYSPTKEDEKLLEDVAMCGLSVLTGEDKESEENYETEQERV